jgi:ABC-type glutathione transport system ATPase component
MLKSFKRRVNRVFNTNIIKNKSKTRLTSSSYFVEVKDKCIRKEPIITVWKEEIENETKLNLKENIVTVFSDAFSLFSKFTEIDEQMKELLMKNDNQVFNMKKNKNMVKLR